MHDNNQGSLVSSDFVQIGHVYNNKKELQQKIGLYALLQKNLV